MRMGTQQRQVESEDELDSDDEEIVFVGRDGAMRELKEKREARYRLARREVSQETVDSGVVFDSFGNDESAAFKLVFPSLLCAPMTVLRHSQILDEMRLTPFDRRWLTHSISDYYGLESRSVTLANSSCRVVYVGLKQVHQSNAPTSGNLPRPLWELC